MKRDFPGESESCDASYFWEFTSKYIAQIQIDFFAFKIQVIPFESVNKALPARYFEIRYIRSGRKESDLRRA